MHRCPTCGELLSSPAAFYACPARGDLAPAAAPREDWRAPNTATPPYVSGRRYKPRRAA